MMKGCIREVVGVGIVLLAFLGMILLAFSEELLKAGFLGDGLDVVLVFCGFVALIVGVFIYVVIRIKEGRKYI